MNGFKLLYRAFSDETRCRKEQNNYALPFTQGTKVPCPSPLPVVNAAAATVKIMPIK